jgi:integrase
VVAWAALAPSAGQRARRLEVVRRFARHVALDDRRHEIPPDGAFGPGHRRGTPYVFSTSEIARIIAAAAALSPADRLRPRTYATLFGLLASTGLRVSEALRLKIEDVTADGLLVRETKFRKSRLVPLHATARAALHAYLEDRAHVDTLEVAVFLSMRGWKLAYGTVAATFREIIRRLGLHPKGRRGPRLHDLRHTFAVRALERCAMDRGAVARHMLALSTYLGHAHLEDTYWYLQATPALLGDIADAAEAYLAGGAS